VPDHLADQIVTLFGQLAEVTPEALTVARRCGLRDRSADGDSDGFLERLVSFTEERVYQQNLDVFAELFEALGVDADSFKRLRKHVSGLTERPFCLLHADLHRENFIVDARHRLWTIDWELAMFGDPLYDLATHLYLMRYPEGQEERMKQRWRAVVEEIRPGSSAGLEHDLPLLLAYKRAQSVFTDVIRVALSLHSGPEGTWRGLVHAGRKLHGILAAAAEPLGLDAVPSPSRIVSAIVRWRWAHRNDPRIGALG
jgi:hypothetical protein